MSNSTQNDEIKQMEKAIDEGFAKSEKDLKDKKTPLDKPTQNDWEKRFNKKFSNGEKGIQWGGYWEDVDMFISTVKIEDVKAFIAKELADARKEGGLKHYMRVSEHLRQYGRDRLMKDDERARGFYGAIEELERYFGLATLREEEGSEK